MRDLGLGLEFFDPPRLVAPADETRDAMIKAARETAREALGRYFRAGALRSDALEYVQARGVRLNLELAMETGHRLPRDVLEYLDRLVAEKQKEATAPPRKRGQRPNTVRDHFILSVIGAIRRYGIAPRRGAAARAKNAGESGCKIVAELLGELGINLTERGVEEVWSQRANVIASIFSIRHLGRLSDRAFRCAVTWGIRSCWAQSAWCRTNSRNVPFGRGAAEGLGRSETPVCSEPSEMIKAFVLICCVLAAFLGMPDIHVAIPITIHTAVATIAVAAVTASVNPIFVSVAAAAEILATSRSEIYQKIARGELDAVKDGMRTKITFESVKNASLLRCRRRRSSCTSRGCARNRASARPSCRQGGRVVIFIGGERRVLK